MLTAGYVVGARSRQLAGDHPKHGARPHHEVHVENAGTVKYVASVAEVSVIAYAEV